ncbi:unnamed protein product [Lepeophtheirus salmonis]|uniref:(salmon louse) hypothetical protein n=1 Tax=Lepeophtheirus salmonis TaxID=72036 RepID=A0A7R8CR33_LEPSM|nr:unnamed protein product [Lepeophtheirus salmonis]CAF2898924.1 unnamed protein product [Lepeophtheirus salmonis]
MVFVSFFWDITSLLLVYLLFAANTEQYSTSPSQQHKVLNPLYLRIKPGKKGQRDLTWNDEANIAFEAANFFFERRVKSLRRPLQKSSLSYGTDVITYTTIADALASSTELHEMLDNPTIKIQKISITGTNISLYADVSSNPYIPYIPQRFRHKMFVKLHGLSHRGIRASQCLMTSRFIWPSINKDVLQWTRTCIKCQTAKVMHHTVSPPQAFTPISTRFKHLILTLKTAWTSSLPLILLGIRSALNEDLGLSSSEIVLGITLRLPGEFMCISTTLDSCSPREFTIQLKEAMSQLKSVSSRETKPKKILVSQDLMECTPICWSDMMP